MRRLLFGVALCTLSSKLHTVADQRDERERNSPFCVMLSSLSAATVVSSTAARLCWFYTEHSAGDSARRLIYHVKVFAYAHKRPLGQPRRWASTARSRRAE
ncbi:hypothetical protein EVAR_41238_1 [Eumeta japonica]|uniref:Uncharacterized protein n=1 Tax=Eumeta variegata TaxID=151549 RepID=A0A4C1W345_EUMVA|nr:hypothetical protein EVAR_41238_1 [Eumeta japonica]